MSDSDEGFGFAIPAGLIAQIQKAEEHARMMTDANEARIDAFLSGLDVEQLLALRTLLNAGEMKKTAEANYFDGQCVAILRYVHKVDPYTGKDPMEGLGL